MRIYAAGCMVIAIDEHKSVLHVESIMSNKAQVISHSLYNDVNLDGRPTLWTKYVLFCS